MLAKGRYYKYTFQSKIYDNMKTGKLYKIEGIGDYVKRGGVELLVTDEEGTPRAFSLTEKTRNVYYKNFGEIINVSHTIDDLLQMYSDYKFLLGLPSDNSVQSQRLTRQYKLMITTIEQRLELLAGVEGK